MKKRSADVVQAITEKGRWCLKVNGIQGPWSDDYEAIYVFEKYALVTDYWTLKYRPVRIRPWVPFSLGKAACEDED